MKRNGWLEEWLPHREPNLHYPLKGKTCLQRDLKTGDPAGTGQMGAAVGKGVYDKRVSMGFTRPNIVIYLIQYA
ncbi:hypothetical protein BH24BAC1_BH24BAC1_00050 [soil metagenome]